MQAHVLEGGFDNHAVDSSHAFRAVMTAMARPGQIATLQGALPPAPLSKAAGVVLLTLCDPETPIYLAPSHDSQQLRDWITFHTGAPFVTAEAAIFAVGTWQDLPVSAFAIGTAEYPDRSATLIVECESLSNTGAVLRGPGIKDQTALSLPKTDAFQSNAALFPLGLDFIFTCSDRLAALPRTTRVG
ncbi:MULTISPECIES: phosphonate C-P lyase system protein PhnH [Pacificibacter]|uniref:phosphonate C-P lyase system protein PhnH n=1 Tax=Pacificibacter TaxID=1042323 RepID=UPI001C07F233|nr:MULTISPECIES: phosphonate C-P lyase system protein PhnH [Pacificibacter]MBU2935667.1 phosphonate C-P lyase system protein PhnH [Pacificibacter marinus]MDO6614163.1 phosphonate C-P lyase system protein PhnH [Pacificibacter sp. 1_MG-2023]